MPTRRRRSAVKASPASPAVILAPAAAAALAVATTTLLVVCTFPARAVRAGDWAGKFELDCRDPGLRQQIAGKSIDFRIGVSGWDGAGVPMAAERVGQHVQEGRLCVAVNQSAVKCDILKDTDQISTGARGSVQVRFNLVGFPPGSHAYSVTLHVENTPEVRCENLFLTRPFPGWDQYVQQYFDINETRKRTAQLPGPVAQVSQTYFEPTNFERLSQLLGPSTRDVLVTSDSRRKTLVVTFAGKSSLTQIDGWAQRFSRDPRFTFMIFAYDRTDWAGFEWIDRVVVVRVTQTMKWRFVKSFLHVDAVSFYEHVVLMDEDVNIDDLDLGAFLDDMSKYGVAIGQPSNGPGSYGCHDVVRQRPDKPVGVWTNFVECGPMLAISTEVWPCIYDMLQPDVTCGFGYDLVWQACGRTAVLHQHTMIHENRKPASSRPNFVMRCAAEGLTLFERLSEQGIIPVDPAELRDFSADDIRTVGHGASFDDRNRTAQIIRSEIQRQERALAHVLSENNGSDAGEGARFEDISCKDAGCGNIVLRIDGHQTKVPVGRHENRSQVAAAFSWVADLGLKGGTDGSAALASLANKLQLGERDVEHLRDPEPAHRAARPCEISGLALDSTAADLFRNDWYLDVVLAGAGCSIVMQRSIGTFIPSDILLPASAPTLEPTMAQVVLIALTWDVTDIEEQEDVFSRVSRVVQDLRAHGAPNLAVGLSLFRDEFVEFPEGLSLLFDFVLRNHFSAHACQGNTHWVPLGWDPDFPHRDKSVQAISLSARPLLANFIGNKFPALYSTHLKLRIFGSSRKHLLNAVRDLDASEEHADLRSRIRRKFPKLDPEAIFLTRGNAVYAGIDSVFVKQGQVPDRVPPETFRRVLERSMFTFIPSSVGTIDAARFYQALEAGSIPILEGPLAVTSLPLASSQHSLGHHPFPVINNSCWEECLPKLFESFLLADETALDGFQSQTQTWWVDFRNHVTRRIGNVIRSTLISPKAASLRGDLPVQWYVQKDLIDGAKALVKGKNRAAEVLFSRALVMDSSVQDRSAGKSLRRLNLMFTRAECVVEAARHNSSTFGSWSSLHRAAKDSLDQMKEATDLMVAAGPERGLSALAAVPAALYKIASAHLWMHEYEAAIDYSRRSLAFFPNIDSELRKHAHNIIDIASWKLGRASDAYEAIREGIPFLEPDELCKWRGLTSCAAGYTPGTWWSTHADGTAE